MEEQNEIYIKQKYDNIVKNKVAGYSLISLKLKNFREYCHRMGHDKADAIILESHRQLKQHLQTDETIEHMYANYFLLLIHCPPSLDYLHMHVSKFHYAVKDAMNDIYGTPLYIEMGFYPITDFEIDFFNAQYFADLCRYGPHHLYPESSYDMYGLSFKDQNEEFLKLENKVASAIEKGHFKLYLQPKVDTKTGKVTSAEALMRWVDPKVGMIPLESFLPNIEDNGSIRDVDIYLFDKGCQYIEKWKKQYHKNIDISFNLSRAHFNGPYFVSDYREVFERYDIDGERICIELLESVVLNEKIQLQSVMEGIATLGFHSALDDFGSGFSSFDIITNITLSELKLDQSLFQNFHNKKEHVMLKHLVDIAHTYHMRVVAEGIETKEYAQYLKEIGCDLIQGFYYYKPMPVEEFEAKFILGK